MPQQAAPPVPCSRCHALIHVDDLDHGFAIYVQGKPVCKVCVDTGQQVGPQQRRSTKQIEVQNQHIARFSDLNNPDLNRFTFLTAGHITLHRKIVREQGSFNPPELKKEHETKAIKKSTARHAKKSEHDVITSHGHERRHRTPVKKGNPIVVFAIVAVVVIAVVVGLSLSSADSQPSHQQENVATQEEKKDYRRNDFPANPVEAWRQAAAALAADNKILRDIAGEIETQSAKQFQQINALLEQGKNEEALKIAQNLQIPRHARFELLADRQVRLQEQCKEAVQEHQRKIALKTEVVPEKDNENSEPAKKAEPDTVVDNKVIEEKPEGVDVAQKEPENQEPEQMEEVEPEVAVKEPVAVDLQESVSRLPRDFDEMEPLDQLKLLIGDVFQPGNTKLRLNSHGKLTKSEDIAAAAIKDGLLNIGNTKNNFFRFYFKGKGFVLDKGFLVFRMKPLYKDDTANKILFSGSHKTGALVDCYVSKEVHTVKLRRDYRNTKWDIIHRIPNEDIWRAMDKDGFVEIAIDWDLLNYEGGVYLNGQRVYEENKQNLLRRFTKLPVRKPQLLEKMVFGAKFDGKVQAQLDVLYFRIFPERKVTGDRYNMATLEPIVVKPLAAAHETAAWQEQAIDASLGVKNFVLSDVNNDGFTDIVVSGDGRKMKFCQFFLNDGKGDFTKQEPHITKQKSADLLAVGDLSGDGIDDILCIEDDHLIGYRSAGKKVVNFSPMDSIKIPIKEKVNKLLIADLNKDGHGDIILLMDKKKNIVLFNNPQKSVAEWNKVEFGDKLTRDAVCLDINADDRLDIISINGRRNKVLAYHLQTNGAFGETVVKDNIVKLGCDRIVLSSDEEKVLGVLLCEKPGKASSLFYYAITPGEWKQEPAKTWQHAPQAYSSFLNAAYSRMDETSLMLSAGGAHVFINTATGESGKISDNEFKLPSQPVFADFNNDGLLDCLFVNKKSRSTPQSLYVFLRKAAEISQ